MSPEALMRKGSSGRLRRDSTRCARIILAGIETIHSIRNGRLAARRARYARGEPVLRTRPLICSRLCRFLPLASSAYCDGAAIGTACPPDSTIGVVASGVLPAAGHDGGPGVTTRGRSAAKRTRAPAERATGAGVGSTSRRRMVIASRARCEGLAAPSKTTVTVRPPASARMAKQRPASLVKPVFDKSTCHPGAPTSRLVLRTVQRRPPTSTVWLRWLVICEITG